MNKDDRLPIGITNTSYGVYGKWGRYDKMAADGYDCVDFQELANTRADFFNLPEDELMAELTKEREYVEALGMRISQAHAPWIGGEGRDQTPEDRANWMLCMKKAIRGTAALGCDRFVLHALLPYEDTDTASDEVVRLNESFVGTVADYAREYGITVCLENLPFKNHPVSSVKAVCALVDRLDRDNLKVCLDTGHAAVFDADVPSAVRYIGKRLGAVHIHDNMGDRDAHLIPGDGIIDWDGFALALREIGYSGVVSLETSPKHGVFPKERWNEQEKLLVSKALDIATKAKK